MWLWSGNFSHVHYIAAQTRVFDVVRGLNGSILDERPLSSLVDECQTVIDRDQTMLTEHLYREVNEDITCHSLEIIYGQSSLTRLYVREFGSFC
jgi:hypothetical protein